MSNCPSCNTGALTIVSSIELGPDDESDSYRLEAFACAGCALEGAGYRAENRRGTDTHWNHFGFAMAHENFAALDKELKACPAPKSNICTCATHMRYGATTGNHDAMKKLAFANQVQLSLG